MSKEYYSLVTKVGQAKIANASVYGTKVDIKTIKLGDGNGAEYNPTEDQTDLKRVVYTGAVGAVRIDPDRGNTIILESIIPQDQGGFTIREIGYYDTDGDLIVIAKYKSQYKPVIGSGATVDMKVNTLIVVSNTENVELKIDNTLIFATKEDVNKVDKKIGELQNLQTENKTDIVAAINEVKKSLDDIELSAEKTSYNDETTELGASDVQHAIEKTVEKINSINKEVTNIKSEPIAYTILQSGWSGNKYSLESEYPKRTYDLEIVDFGDSATKENMWAYFDGMIKGSLTENVLTATDVVPTVDIPVLLKVVKKNAAE